MSLHSECICIYSVRTLQSHGHWVSWVIPEICKGSFAPALCARSPHGADPHVRKETFGCLRRTVKIHTRLPSSSPPSLLGGQHPHPAPDSPTRACIWVSSQVHMSELTRCDMVYDGLLLHSEASAVVQAGCGGCLDQAAEGPGERDRAGVVDLLMGWGLEKGEGTTSPGPSLSPHCPGLKEHVTYG